MGVNGRNLIGWALCLLLMGCQSPPLETRGLFEIVLPEDSGVSFANMLEEDPAFNILTYLYYYDGGGVAIGDIDNDGLPDIYFTSNLDENRLYRNMGDFRFEDVTVSAGVAGRAGWTKGATMVDINADGYLDIYVSVVNHLSKRGKNQLFINNGDLTFTEQAEVYGLDQEAYATQAVFFDYDNDGDVDVYQVNHSVHTEGTYGNISLRSERHPAAGDKLLRNDNGSFVDVSEEAGIIGGVIGYGLGAAVSDLNNDGCLDIYVSNDFHENDYLYINQCDGTFQETIYDAVGHTSRSSMGNDAADFNNDGWSDVVVVDMLPDREDIRKTAVSADNYDVDAIKARAGYHDQYARNTLLLNKGEGRFSDISYLAGVEATDWSWSVLFADLDLDGQKDIFVTNGIYRRPNDLDYLRFARQPEIHAMLQQNPYTEQHMDLIQEMPQVPIPNYVFRNKGDLTFESVGEEWGLGTPGFSNGAAYADLDLDGDLDLVVNNLGATASLYKNQAKQQSGHNHLAIRLIGEGANLSGIGARVGVKNNGTWQFLEMMPTRGWESSVDHRLHVGLGSGSTAVDSLRVQWPDRRVQVLTNVPANQLIEVRQEDAKNAPLLLPTRPPYLFTEIDDEVMPFAHEENRFFDFSREALIPHLISQEGPALAVGDVNGDGLDDVFVGGAKWQSSRLYVQGRDGTFSSTNESLWHADSLQEHVDAAFFDADGDGDFDLYVVAAGNEFWGTNDAIADRFYRNKGNGAFEQDTSALPGVFGNNCCVRPADYDADGDIDLFIGGRVTPRNYGVVPRSYLLENDGTGRYSDVTAVQAPELEHVGMVTDAAWIQANTDGRLDLAVVGEWRPVQIFTQGNEGFVLSPETGLEQTHGLWASVTSADFDGDGDEDLVAGNLGRNSLFRASMEQPIELYVHDIDNNGTNDPLITMYRHDEPHLFASVDELMLSIPELQQTHTTYASFGDKQLDDLFTADRFDGAERESAYFFDSIIAWNEGDGTFRIESLPVEAQLSPIRDVWTGDVNDDGHRDIVAVGNTRGVSPRRGKYDASYGHVLLGDGNGVFNAIPPYQTGFWFRGDGRQVRVLHLQDNRRVLVTSRNKESLQLFEF